MKRSLIIGGGIALFAGSAALATFIADSAQHEPTAVLPSPAAGAVGVQVVAGAPLVSPDASGAIEPVTAEELRAESGGWAPGGEYVPLVGTAAASEDSAGPEDSAGSEDPVASVELDASFAPAAGTYALRFQDLCAIDPAAGGCPLGIGGTILPLSDPVYPAFDLISILDATDEDWGCSGDPRAGQFLIGLTANHPARIEVRYWQIDTPAEVRTREVDSSAPDSPVLARFLDLYDSPTPPTSYLVSHCTYLDIDLGGAYVIEAHATSFTGEVDDLVQQVLVPLQRPPVIVIPRGDYQLKIGVPVASETNMYSKVRLIERLPDADICFDLTTETLLSEELATAPATGRFERRDDTYGERSIRSPYDLTYDSLDLWTFDLKEGTPYLMCVWWLRSPDGSLDPADSEVVGVEQREISTPDMMRTVISATFMMADEDGPDIEAGSYTVWIDDTVWVDEPCESWATASVPPVDIQEGTGTWSGAEVELCTRTGVEAPTTTRIHVERPDGQVKNFWIPTPNTKVDYIELISLYFGDDPACATSAFLAIDGCFGPRLTVKVSHIDALIGPPDWEIGIAEAVQPPA